MPSHLFSNHILRRVIRSGLGGRISQWLVIAILLARALVSVNAMVDMEAAKQGHFTLVLCSGHGPMFSRAAFPMLGITGSHMHHEMGIAMPKSAGDKSQPKPGADDSMPADGGFCPFSSSLVVAYVALALCIALLALLASRHLRRARVDQPPWLLLPYSRPLTRAPPSFC